MMHTPTIVRHFAFAALLSACATGRATSTRYASDTVRVAYGAQQRRDLTVSVGSLAVDDAMARGQSRVEELLVGRVAGLEVRRNGRDYTLLVRGREPLIVVDGVAMSGQNARNLLADLSPRDVARIDVLRDAGASAAYGSRGGNGVVLITLRRP